MQSVPVAYWTVNQAYGVVPRQNLLVFCEQVQPENGNSGPYMCKLQSNMGALHLYTPLELEECAGMVQGLLTSEGPACTFNSVHPDGDVHWFHGSHNLSDGPAKHNTTKRVGEGGWLTIHSNLQWESSDVPFNCSLKSSKSGRYIANTLIHKSASAHGASRSLPNGVRSHGPLRIFLCISVLLAVTLK
ncbi:Hypothetical protein SMAX5B_007600 [Scophthalmus maximus]|uniref:Ig-like domain-containing protein n=1 Tax=Scophthalmus maximus TaxID=52904 RepID=A0A2U9BQE3_SCOMX|nr:Hypothetical protein SMAX5B_007600 [Scophthalmus maximus]